MDRVLIAAPVLRREWIIGSYLEHAAASAAAADVEATFLMVGGIDDPTFAAVDEMMQFDVLRIYVDEPRSEDKRDWPTPGRIDRMVDLRNIILYQARTGSYDFLLSLDSDILAHPDLIGNLIESQRERRWDAVGGYCYLSQSRSHPSYANLQGRAMRRPPIEGQVERCDVIMAIKLLTPTAWEIGYEHHRHGEDVGWSLAVKRAGMKVGIDARAVNKHVMSQRRLELVDKRLGW